MQYKTSIIISVLAVVALSTVANNHVFATSNFMPYGSIGQEDQNYVRYDGFYWVNTGAHLGVGNGQFMKITDLDNDYSIDQAIERFGINEDVTEFTVQPSLNSDTVFVYQLDSDLQFQNIGAFE